MRQTRKLKRRRKRRLRKGFKIFLIVLCVLIAIMMIVMFGFQLQTVKISTDLGQFTNQEVKSYMDAKEIDNTLILWLKNKTGHSTEIELLEEYHVTMKSPFEVKLSGYEKKLMGYIEKDGMNYYFDEYGTILKVCEEKIQDIPVVEGLNYSELKLYEKIKIDNKKVSQYLLDVAVGIEEYSFHVSKIELNSSDELTIYIKKLQVQLGKNINLDRKLKTLKDMYSQVILQNGTLNMKHASEDGSYTIRKNEEKKPKQNK